MTADDLLSRADVARRIGVLPDSLSRAGLPEPDLVAGGRRYWRAETIDRWGQRRPGPGARTDVHQVITLPGLQVGAGHGPQGHLAALGLLRVLHEQRPEWKATLDWHRAGDVRFRPGGFAAGADPAFVHDGCYPVLTLRSATATGDELARWLLSDYAATPAISPWNAGSGLGLGYVQGRQKSSARKVPELDTISDLGARGEQWNATLSVARDLVGQARREGWEKARLITECHDRYPESALPWVDACWEWVGDGSADSPLRPVPCLALGTGGNVGSADLGAIMARQFATTATRPASGAWLGHALASEGAPPLIEGTAAHLGMTGLVQPWLWLLAMEGLIGVCAVPRLLRGVNLRRSPCVLAPGDTSGLAVVKAEIDHELWLPLWAASLTWPQLRAALTGGQWLQWRGRGAADGTHAALALDAARDNVGLDAYRYICAIRNGRNPVYLTL